MPRQKITLDEAQQEFIKRGHMPLFKIYNNNHEKLEYKCKCGNENICHINLNCLKNGVDNCQICSINKKKTTDLERYNGNANGLRITLEQAKEEFTNKGHTPLFETYNNNHEKLAYKCACGNENICYIALLNLKNNQDNCENCINIKQKNNNMQKYGMESHFLVPEIKNKIKQTFLDKHQVENAFQSKEIRKKATKTYIERYGVVNPFSANEIKQKIAATNLSKYGTINPMQNKEIFEKNQKKRFYMKEYKLPKSNKTIKVQGYEPFCLNDLLQNEHIDEEELLKGYKERPVIKYKYNEKNHYYHPDIYIPSENKIIEVKSQYTFDNNKEINLLKLEATKLLGYNAEIRIYDKKGGCIEKIT